MITLVMHVLLLLLGAGAFFLSVFLILLYSSFFRSAFSRMSHSYSFRPRVSVLAPVRGFEEGMEKNIRSLLTQGYPRGRWEIIFLVDEDEHAEEKIRDIVKKSKAKNARVFSSVKLPYCSGKNSALLLGLKKARYDVVVGYDSDAFLRKDWLASLVGPLEDRNVGATTGYRFYMPAKSFVTCVVSAWNALSFSSMKEPFTFVWGGSFAIRKSTLKELKIPDHWKRSMSDDAVITNALKAKKLRIYFVPQCVARSYHSRYSHITEFTTRQITITKWYWPRFYRAGFAMFVYGRVSTVLGLVTAGLYLSSENSLFLLESFLFLWPVVFDLLRASMNFRHFRALLGESPGSRAKWVAADFLAQWLVAYNFIAASRKDTVTWRGRIYDLKKELSNASPP